MTPESAAAFAVAFFLLALAPGPGLAAILSRALGSGLAAGFAVTTGLMVGDFVFMAVAVAGLSAIAAALGPMFLLVKYVGAAYLVWLGYRALTGAAAPIALEARAPRAPWRDVGLGLLVTLGNPKPILFYGALLPTFLDITRLGAGDYVALGAIVVAVSVAVYGAYMLLADRARRLVTSARAVKRLNQATGTMLIGSGIVVASR